MSAIETEIINKSPPKPLVSLWKRFINDIFSLWNVDKEEIYSFMEQANNHHPTVKFTAEVSETETAFLDTCNYKGERFKKESILDVRTHLKPTETFQYTYFSSCHPPGVKKGFIKSEALRLLRTNSSEKMFEEKITNFKRRLRMRGYRNKVTDKHLSEVKHHERMSALQKQNKNAQENTTIRDRISPLSTEPTKNHHAQMVSYRKPTVA